MRLSRKIFIIKFESEPRANIRHPELDILRAFAVLLVLGRHLIVIPDSLSPSARDFFLVWQRIGWIGVDFFFVVSGFLISGLLFTEQQKTGKIRIGRFLIRRGFKIYPPFYALMLVTIFTATWYNLPIVELPMLRLRERFFSWTRRENELVRTGLPT